MRDFQRIFHGFQNISGHIKRLKIAIDYKEVLVIDEYFGRFQGFLKYSEIFEEITQHIQKDYN